MKVFKTELTHEKDFELDILNEFLEKESGDVVFLDFYSIPEAMQFLVKLQTKILQEMKDIEEYQNSQKLKKS